MATGKQQWVLHRQWGSPSSHRLSVVGDGLPSLLGAIRHRWRFPIVTGGSPSPVASPLSLGVLVTSVAVAGGSSGPHPRRWWFPIVAWGSQPSLVIPCRHWGSYHCRVLPTFIGDSRRRWGLSIASPCWCWWLSAIVNGFPSMLSILRPRWR